MATSQRLVINFECEDGKKHNFSFSNASELPRTADVKTLISTMKTNGAIFQNVPVNALSAKVIVTTSSEIDISD